VVPWLAVSERVLSIAGARPLIVDRDQHILALQVIGEPGAVQLSRKLASNAHLPEAIRPFVNAIWFSDQEVFLEWNHRRHAAALKSGEASLVAPESKSSPSKEEEMS
jgi:hypothetical protein